MNIQKTRKSQVTTFVIIALLFVGLIAGYFLYRNNITNSQTALASVPAELTPVTNSIQQCVQSALEYGTKLVGLQGGYIIPPDNALETNISYIAYGYLLGKNTLASKEIIAKEIAQYIEITLHSCTYLSAFPEYQFSMTSPKATVKINPDSVTASANYGFTAAKEGSSWKLNPQYSASYNVKLGRILNVSDQIIAKEIENPDSFDMSFLGSLEYDVSISYSGNDIIVYTLQDYNLNETGPGYTFRFANKLR